MQERVHLEQELSALAPAARQRRSVDLFLRAAIEAFSWVVLTGISIKLFHDSKRPPLFLWPLLLLDVLLLWDAVRGFLSGRTALQRERRVEARVRELRAQLEIDP
jgi:hypothetical protein